MLLEEAAALRERHWMRRHAPQAGFAGAGPDDQAMPDAKLGLAHDVERRGLEAIVVLVDRAGERVLDRYEAALGLPPHYRGEQRIERGPRQHVSVCAEGEQRRLVAEGAALALDGDPHCAARSVDSKRQVIMNSRG